jgi:hypothetical protein
MNSSVPQNPKLWRRRNQPDTERERERERKLAELATQVQPNSVCNT